MVSGLLVTDGQGRGVSRTLARAAAVADRRVTGLSRRFWLELLVEPGPAAAVPAWRLPSWACRTTATSAQVRMRRLPVSTYGRRGPFEALSKKCGVGRYQRSTSVLW